MNEHTMADTETVAFWRWISTTTIALVTLEAVFH